jgi:hypothetical protein
MKCYTSSICPSTSHGWYQAYRWNYAIFSRAHQGAWELDKVEYNIGLLALTNPHYCYYL